MTVNKLLNLKTFVVIDVSRKGYRYIGQTIVSLSSSFSDDDDLIVVRLGEAGDETQVLIKE